MLRTCRSQGVGRGVLALTLLYTALALVPGPAQARHPDLDLDRISQQRFYEMLDDELDDDDLAYCRYGDLGAAHRNEDVYNAVICALGDAGDTDEETDLDYDDLEAEVNEAGTTVEKVVWAAILEADRRADGGDPREILLALLRGGLDSTATGTDADTLAPQWYAIQNGSISPGPANVRGPVKDGLDRARRTR